MCTSDEKKGRLDLLMKWIKHVSLGWFIQCKMAIIANLVFKWNGYIKLIFGYFTQCRVTMFKYQVMLGDTWHDTAKTGDQGVTLAPGHQWHHQHWSQMSQTLIKFTWSSHFGSWNIYIYTKYYAGTSIGHLVLSKTNHMTMTKWMKQSFIFIYFIFIILIHIIASFNQI